MASNNTVGYFHIALMNGCNGLLIAAEMHGRLLDSGLYDATNTINVCVLGCEEQKKTLIDAVFSKYKKYELRFYNDNLQLYEWPTLKIIYEDCKMADSDIWYIHTKGASNMRPDVPLRIQQNLVSWRETMSYYVIKEHKKCKSLLNANDAIGPFLIESDQRHFSGNFWWAKAKHIRTLVNPEASVEKFRNEAELWIGTNSKSLYGCLCGFPEGYLDLYDFSNKFGEQGIFHNIRRQ